MKKICIIPFREGSKRLKNKNIKLYSGKPLYKWTVEFALKCKFFDKIIVATNYNYILRKRFNDKIELYKRSSKNSRDNATLLDLIKEIIKKKSISNSDVIFLLPVTNPFRNIEDLKKIFNKFKKKKYKYPIMSVVKNINPPHLLWKNKSGILKPYQKKITKTQKQAYKDTFIWNDAYLVDKVDNFFLKKNLYGQKILQYEMPYYSSISIDDRYDFEVSEYFFKKYKK